MTRPLQTLRDEMTARGIPFALMAHSEQGEMDAAVAVRHCAAAADGEYASSRQSRAGFHALISDFYFLRGRIGLEPVGPAYEYGDQIFGMIVDWTVYALIEAEALGITQAKHAEAARRRYAGAKASGRRLRDRAFAWAGARLGRQSGRRGRQLWRDFPANRWQPLSSRPRSKSVVDRRRPDATLPDAVIRDKHETFTVLSFASLNRA